MKTPQEQLADRMLPRYRSPNLAEANALDPLPLGPAQKAWIADQGWCAPPRAIRLRDELERLDRAKTLEECLNVYRIGRR